MKFESQLLKGIAPAVVLEILSRGKMYGYELSEAVEQRSNKVLSLGKGTLYPLLYNLEAKKLVEGSWEEMLHRMEPADKLLLMNELNLPELETMKVPHRAIGVVYNPENEKPGNYVPTILPRRYDAFMFFDQTKALNPLHIAPDSLQMPETFPFGL